MKRYFLLILFPALLLISGNLLAQSATVTGTVKDAKTGESLVGATVELVGKVQTTGRIGAITNPEGKYTIRSVPPGEYTLRLQFVGYKTINQKITLTDGETKSMDLEIMPDIIGLDEVVVTGVASRNEKAVSDVAVARVNAAEIQESFVYTDFGQLVAGKIPGVQVQTASGNVGGGMRFQVRGGGGLNGDGQPVIFVDGVRINNDQIGIDVGGQSAGTLADLNPEDIADVEILKGPAGAALYGTSGSNGVVLITTKRGLRGKAGDFFGLNYEYNTGWNEQAVEFSEDDILSAKYANDVFQKGPFSEQTLSMQGKSGIFNYYASFTDRQEDGIVLQNEFDRKSVRANFGAVPNEQLNLNISTNYIVSKNARSQNDNNVQGWMGNTLLASSPWIFTDSSAIAALENVINSNRFIGSANLNYTPNWLPGLSFSGTVGIDAMDYRNDAFSPPGYFYPGVETKGEKNLFQRMRRQMNYDFNASYEYNITEDIKAVSTIGTQMFSNYTESSDLTIQNFATTRITNLNSAFDFISADDGRGDFREAGVFFNQDFNINDTYIFTLGARNDYSSVIGADAPSIFYPRVSAAVRMDKLFDLGVVNFLKFRAGFGQNGQLPGALAAYPFRWAGGQSGFGVGALINSIGNPEIEPERINEVEVGFELELLNAYGIDFTYYQGWAKKSIIGAPNAPSTGLTATSVPTNIGEVKNWGFESMLYATPLMTKNYQLDFNFIFNYSDNEIVKLGPDGQPILGGFGELGWYEGERRSAFIVQKVNGAIFDENGNFVGLDVEDESTYAGTPIPIYNGSFNTSFRFLKNFRLGMLWEFAMGHQVSNQTRSFQVSFGNDVEFNSLSAQLFGGDETITQLTPGTAEYEAAANAYAKLNPNYAANFIEDADWLRLRELSFRADLTEYLDMFIKDSFIRKIAVIASVRNVALFTTYSGADPEVNFDGARTTVTRGIDFLTLQNPRTFTFTLDLGL
jgi:TonB-dependent SusC/RagA subfamily outer membrane receptor